MTKRAQLLSHPIMAIFSLVVIALLLIFGFNAITSLLNLGSTIQTQELETRLTSAVHQVYTEPPGSSSQFHLATPQAIITICFLDLNKDFHNAPPSIVQDATALKETEGVKHNTFFAVTSGAKTPNPLRIPTLLPKEQTCIDTSRGALNAVLENNGNTVDIRSA